MTKFTRLALATAVAALGISETAIARPRHARYPLPQSVATSDGSGPVVYLLDARSAVSASQYARASEALGRAETRLLNDAAISPNRTPPYLQRALTDVAAARATATRHQPTPTVRAINDALLALEPRAASQSAEITTSEPIELLPVTSSPPFRSSPVIPYAVGSTDAGTGHPLPVGSGTLAASRCDERLGRPSVCAATRVDSACCGFTGGVER